MILKKIKQSINYLYYLATMTTKNIYPCKLLGERFDFSCNEMLITYKILGVASIQQITLKKLLENKLLINNFHPFDAIKLGSLAFEEFFSCLNPDAEKKFFEIKNAMLSSTHDIGSTHLVKINYNIAEEINYSEYKEILSSIDSNVYPCKLVDKTISCSSNTIITYTIFGRREGIKKSLVALMEDKKLLSKFHPTESIKLGFIYRGEDFFSTEKLKIQSTNQYTG